MSEYLKRIEDLIKEIKSLKSTNKKSYEELKLEKIKNYDLMKYIEDKNNEISKLKDTLKDTKRIMYQNEKKYTATEKALKNKLRRKEYYEDKKGSRNKMENVLRTEVRALEARNSILEEIMVCFGENLKFNGFLMNKVSEFLTNDDEILKRLIEKVIQRNSEIKIVMNNLNNEQLKNSLSNADENI